MPRQQHKIADFGRRERVNFPPHSSSELHYSQNALHSMTHISCFQQLESGDR